MVLNSKKRGASGHAPTNVPVFRHEPVIRPKTEGTLKKAASSLHGLILGETPRHAVPDRKEEAAELRLRVEHEDSPDPLILKCFLESESDSSTSIAVQRGRLWKAKIEAIRRVDALLGENEDLLQGDPRVGHGFGF